MYHVGRMYKQGKGVRRNPAKALHWLLKAGEQGDANAQYILGCLYNRGEDAVLYDSVKQVIFALADL